MTHLIIYGDEADGFCYVGPFESAEAAHEYIKIDDAYDADTDVAQVVMLYPPAVEE